jgi:cathepsin F
MRITIAVALLAALSLICLASAQFTGRSETELFNEFQLFTKTYNKQYQSAGEAQLRFNNFKASLQRIEERTNRFPNGAKYAINKFSDLTPQEFRDIYLMKNKIPVATGPRKNAKVELLTDMPQKLDWRTRGAVTAVKDQGQCGSCWAFSATETIESAWILAGKATADKLNLAPQQIVDCDGTDAGCDGGEPEDAYDYVIAAGGLESVANYPYTGEDGVCAFNKSEVVAKIKGWSYSTTWYSESELRSNLVSVGPLSVCVDAANWQDYSSGVMDWEECAWINFLDHCVQLVGYDMTAPTPYWIVRNSWNTDWGVKGYIYLAMGDDTCGIAHESTYVTV